MPEPVLEIHGLTKRFGAVVASDAVSLDLRAGEIHALIGPNGAGKSTLIAQIMGELRPDAGEVRLMGRDIGGLGPAARARAGLARSFQVSRMAAEFTVLQNVMLAVMGASGHILRFFRPALRDAALTGPAQALIDRVGLGGRERVPAAALQPRRTAAIGNRDGAGAAAPRPAAGRADGGHGRRGRRSADRSAGRPAR